MLWNDWKLLGESSSETVIVEKVYVQHWTFDCNDDGKKSINNEAPYFWHRRYFREKNDLNVNGKNIFWIKPLQFGRFWVKLLVVISKEYIILLLTNCSFLTEAVLPTYHLRSENQCKMTGFVLSCFNLTNNATASLA